MALPDDDFDDRPRGRGRERARDEYDDRPRGRDDDRSRRRRDDDYDDERPRRRRQYDDDADRPRGGAAAPSNGLATAGLVLGLLGFCSCGLSAIPGLICSVVALGKRGSGLAYAGLVLSGLGLLVGAGGAYVGFTRFQDAKARLRDSNNLKQVALGLHNQDNSRDGVAAPYLIDKSGNTQSGLSWRVGLLPFVEQDSLFRKFDVNQPWDGPTNRSLSNTPLSVYTSPYEHKPDDPSSETPYRVFYGGGALFSENGTPVSLSRIEDGSSNTILAVHAAEQVPWASPRDLKYSAGAALPKLGHPSQSGVFVVALADGSVRAIKKDVSEKTLRGLITRAGGEALGDW